LVAEALSLGKTDRVVDLCSGGSGPMPAVLANLTARGVQVKATLTDRYPNLEAFEKVAAPSGGQISFRADSVDARQVPRDLHGLRTCFNAFHHFEPKDAVAVLRDAAQARQPIAVFEVPDRRIITLISVLVLVPFLVVLGTPFIRPFRWKRLFWTYLLPLVVITTWWDGAVSQLRAYSPEELQSLGESADSINYHWRAGQVRIESPPGYLTYLMGHPRQ
jgi:hypothetical protein